MPDPAVPVAAPDVVERLQRQLTIPLSIMGGESYVLDTDDVREATAEITRLREEVAPVRCPCCEGYRDRGDGTHDHCGVCDDEGEVSPAKAAEYRIGIRDAELEDLRAEVAELRKGTVPMVVQGEELNGAMLEQLDAMKADLNPLMEANNTMAARIAELEAEVTALSKDATFAATANRADRDIVDECRRLQAFHAGKGHYLATQWCMRDAAAEIERLREEVAELQEREEGFLCALRRIADHEDARDSIKAIAYSELSRT